MPYSDEALDLTDDEAAAVALRLRRAVDADPYSLSPRLAPLNAIPAKRDEPYPNRDRRRPAMRQGIGDGDERLPCGFQPV
jgi:hypothetical protein